MTETSKPKATKATKKKAAKAAPKRPQRPKPKTKLPVAVSDEYEAGVIVKFDVRGPTIVWVDTATHFDVWKYKSGQWVRTQSDLKPGVAKKNNNPPTI